MLMFSLANIAPVAGIAYYLKSSIEDRREEMENLANLSDASAYEVSERINSLCRASTNCMLIYGARILPCLPHPPASGDLVLTDDELVLNVDKTIPGTGDIFDSITAKPDTSNATPLRFVHFAVRPDSETGKELLIKSNRRMKLVYSGGFTNDIAVVLEGQATLVEDKRLRNILWRDRWGSFTNKNDYVLVKFETLAASVVSPAAHTIASIVRSPEKAWCRS